ncbi:hypothetical protein QE381_002419 [Microbacterium sp. SORGH_AS 888]|nr:hypothetical protein [Microbacterium sp. SORGH_AS_0888]
MGGGQGNRRDRSHARPLRARGSETPSGGRSRRSGVAPHCGSLIERGGHPSGVRTVQAEGCAYGSTYRGFGARSIVLGASDALPLRGNPPGGTPRVLNSAAEIVVGALFRLADHSPTGRHSSREGRHRVLDIEMNVRGRGGNTTRSAADHDHGVIDPHFGVHQRPVRPVEPTQQHATKRRLEKSDEVFGLPTDEIRAQRGIRDRLPADHVSTLRPSVSTGESSLLRQIRPRPSAPHLGVPMSRRRPETIGLRHSGSHTSAVLDGRAAHSPGAGRAVVIASVSSVSELSDRSARSASGRRLWTNPQGPRRIKAVRIPASRAGRTSLSRRSPT